MDETIGAKGGYNDRRRTLIITNKQKEKLKEKQQEKELKELEEKVKKQQIYTLIKSLPIAIGGGTFKILYDIGTGKKNIDKQEEYSKWKVKEYDADMSVKSRQEKEYEKKKKKVVVIQPDGRKVVVLVPIEEDKKEIDHSIVEDKKEEKKKIHEEEINKQEEVIKGNNKKQEKEIEKEKEIKKEVIEYEEIKETKKEKEDISSKKQEENILKTETKEIEKEENISFDDLTPAMKDKLDKLKARKIIDEYSKQLKDIRYDLRKLISEYNVLVDEKDNAITSKEMEDILDKLSEIIWKVDELKSKIQIDNLDKYDDNYIYTLIEDYLTEFKDKKLISEIKDSPLYIMIAEKLDELDKRKDELNKEVNDKKDELVEKEIDFDKLKEKYYSIDKFNKELIEFQRQQDALLKEVQEKVANAVTVSERVQVEMEAMNLQSRRLLRRLTMAMLFPGTRIARGTALTTAAYLSFVRQILNPRTTTRRYRVINVEDYSSDIEYTISSIEDAIGMLGKTSKQVDKLISQIYDEFKDYIGVIKECDELLSNLQKVKSDLAEKEYEMERVKKAQERELEKNNAKVLTRGEYPM